MPAGTVQLLIQVEEAQYQVQPLEMSLDVGPNECASLLIRQREGYDLELFGVGPCP